ncbi:MAG: iron uptake porin [Microcystaceae cyanobacterium]
MMQGRSHWFKLGLGSLFFLTPGFLSFPSWASNFKSPAQTKPFVVNLDQKKAIAPLFSIGNKPIELTSDSQKIKPFPKLVKPTKPISLQAFSPLEGNITSVSSLRDVSPTDWAYQALLSLAERYGCLAGHPDFTFRGNRAMTRSEFAAGLNACQNSIKQLLQENSKVLNEDLEVLKRLSRDFESQLAALAGRVSNLESRIGYLEDHQFSTTTKLNGIANFVLTGSSGEGETNVVFQQRVRLTANTSFTGRDLLVARMAMGNSTIPNLGEGTKEVTQANQWYGDFNNRNFLVTLSYLFPVTDRLTMLITPVGGLHADYAYPPVNPYFEDFNGGTTTLSTFAQRNQILSLGGGTGTAFSYRVTNSLTWGGGYYAGLGNIPSQGNGLFNGTFSAGTSLKWQATEGFTLGANYIHGYFTPGSFGFSDNATSFGLPAYSGTAIANNTLAKYATNTNAYGGEFFWQPSPNFGIGAWIGYAQATAIGVGKGELWNYALSFVFPNLGQEGNLGAFIIGAQPYLGSLTGVESFPNSTPLHLEAFYRYQINNNLSITPGVIWHPAPNQNQSNPDIITGTIRTTFTF